jgi:hypothetical protein
VTTNPIIKKFLVGWPEALAYFEKLGGVTPQLRRLFCERLGLKHRFGSDGRCRVCRCHRG